MQVCRRPGHENPKIFTLLFVFVPSFRAQPFQTGAKASGFLCPLCHSRFDEMETLLRHHDICDGTPVESPGRQHADTGLSDSETDSSEDMSVGT